MAAVLSSKVYASTVLPAPASTVFELIEPMTFKWSSSVSTARKEAPAEGADESSIINICYSDNTIQKIEVVEYSKIDRSITWEVIASEPAAAVMSQMNTITCRRVTSDDTCFLEWTSDFSSDVTADAIEDSKWKKKEAFSDLASFLGGGGEAPAAEAEDGAAAEAMEADATSARSSKKRARS